jgi:hypothetical protein
MLGNAWQWANPPELGEGFEEFGAELDGLTVKNVTYFDKSEKGRRGKSERGGLRDKPKNQNTKEPESGKTGICKRGVISSYYYHLFSFPFLVRSLMFTVSFFSFFLCPPPR